MILFVSSEHVLLLLDMSYYYCTAMDCVEDCVRMDRYSMISQTRPFSCFDSYIYVFVLEWLHEQLVVTDGALRSVETWETSYIGDKSMASPSLS
jgi:hypothetical protein